MLKDEVVLVAEEIHFPSVPKAELFLGAAYTGKTQNLLLGIQSLLSEKADASEILVFCATPDAAQNFSTRLQGVCPGAKKIEVTTPRAFFLDLLATAEAFAATGRKARLLLPFEYDFFLEDLKTSGTKPGRLREMLKFLYRGFSELADDDEEWLLTNEERELVALIKNSLSFTGAVLEPELANLAVNYLRNNKKALGKAGKSYVFVDDFQLLSRASQFASCLLAKECLYLAADQDVALEAYESYPYLDGVDEFMQANPRAAVTYLTTSYSCYTAAKASCALRKENGIDVSKIKYSKVGKKTSFRLIEGDTPQDEMTQVVDAVEQALHSGLSANDIVIAAPHSVWTRNLMHQLKARGIPAEILPDAHFLKGDIRSNEKCFNARFLTMLSLIADPTDAVAWRCWCGFGDTLANSNGMLSLRNQGQPQGKTLDLVLGTSDMQQDTPPDTQPSTQQDVLGGFDMLEGLGTIIGVQRIAKAYKEARALIKRLSGLSGQALLEAIAKELAGSGVRVPEKIESLAMGCEGSLEADSAATMVSRMRTCLEFPVYSCDDVVRLVSYENVVGMNPRNLFLAGFMNGFFPKDDYFDATVLTIEQMEKRYISDLSCIAGVVAKASDTLAVSYCKKLDLEDAERLKLCINRIFVENNKRLARTEASIFLKFIQS